MSKGNIKWINPPGNKGKILSTDESPAREYEFNVSSGDVVSPYKPVVGDNIIFTKSGGSTATSIQLDSTGRAVINFFYHYADSSTLAWQTTGSSAAFINEIPCPLNSDPNNPVSEYDFGSAPYTLRIDNGFSQVAEEK